MNRTHASMLALIRAIGRAAETVESPSSPWPSAAMPAPPPVALPVAAKPVAEPPALAITGIGQTAVVTVREPGYRGAFYAVTANPRVARVAATPEGAFVVTTTGVGITALVFSDAFGDTVTVSVTVSMRPPAIR